jgi:hypothetical protein
MERAPPGTSKRARVALKWMKRTIRLRIAECVAGWGTLTNRGQIIIPQPRVPVGFLPVLVWLAWRWNFHRTDDHFRRACLFIIAHDLRRILHFNITQHPTSLWIVQQLREAIPFDPAPRPSSSLVMQSTAWKSPQPFESQVRWQYVIRFPFLWGNSAESVRR